MALNVSMSYASTWALSLALGLWPCQAFLAASTRYGEPLFSGWLFCFTDLDTNFVLLLSVVSTLWALHGRSYYSSLVFIWVAFDLTCPAAFTIGGPKFSNAPTPSLFNGALFLHPPVLYFSIAYTTLLAYYTTYKAWAIIRPRLSLHPLRVHAFGVTLVALILGGLWAQQELNWGGWWSWDLVEAGTLLLALFNLFHLHFKNWVYQLPHLAPLVLFFFFFFFEGLRYGLFDSVHSFISLSQADFLAFTAYYFLFFLFGLKKFKYYSRHIMITWILASLGLIGLAFVGDFMHKYYGLPWAWPLNRHLLIVFIFFFGLLAKPESFMFKGALGPYFLNVLNLKTMRVFKARPIHTAFLSLVVGLSISKGVTFSHLGFDLPQESIWVIHHTYIVPLIEMWDLFPANSQTLSLLSPGYLSLRWTHPTQGSQLNNQLVTWQVNWLQDFVGYTLLADLAQITWSLDFGFFLYLFLIKKSRN